MAESRGFDRLHEGVKRWVWGQGWTSLRDIQEEAIEPILNADCDVIISAPTAGGKTEAAFLPACSRIANLSPSGIGILYISPLKALINDQYRRLQSLCDTLGFPATPWHGDVVRSVKDKQRIKPEGILLITPESLESLLLNQSGWCKQAFSALSHIIVDEFHAFIGTERGCQLQSLMRRLEFLLQRTVPRIALSATLGDMAQVAYSLRPNGEFPHRIINSSTSRSDLKIQLRGYIDPGSPKEDEPEALDMIVDDLYRVLRGNSHLVFANSRRRTEQIAAMLADSCESNGVPNEFFPHHGNLSREIRESLESRLQQDHLPTSAVCTMTLELGIDIGSVDSIAQVTAPHSVASLRQRLGRSGRRGDPAVLRLFIPEAEITGKSHPSDRLRLQTIQCIAMINLLLAKWYEPAPVGQYHLSTLVQQTLSVIGQYGGVRANQLWALLCDTGPFSRVDQPLYSAFLRVLGSRELITQTQDGQLVLGHNGEKFVEHYSFYTAFNTPEEYRLECDGRALGTIPIDRPLAVGQSVVFAGRRWEVLDVNDERKLVTLKPAAGGQPPTFGGTGQAVHSIVRQEMKRIYLDRSMPVYLDRTAMALFSEGVDCFHSLGLGQQAIVELGSTVHLFPWLSDRITHTIAIILRAQGLSADSFAGVIDVQKSSADSVRHATRAAFRGSKPSATELAHVIPDTIVEKHDLLLPKEMRDLGYGARCFDVDGAFEWLAQQQELPA